MESSGSALPIKVEDLNAQLPRAKSFLVSVKWRPKSADLFTPKTPAAGSIAWRESTVRPAEEEALSVLEIAKLVSGDSDVLAEEINYTLHVLMQGLGVGYHLTSMFIKTSGLEMLIAANAKSALTAQQSTEFREKQETAAAIAVFVTSYYIARELSSYKAEEIGNIALEIPGIPEIFLNNPLQALMCLIYYYAAYLKKSGKVFSSLDFVKLTLLYFRLAVEEIKLREGSLKHTGTFTDRIYKLEKGDFSVNGFQAEMNGAEVSIEFNQVDFGEIVGNREAKHNARRAAQRLNCYDSERKRNPFLDLGGFAKVRMGFGIPGTGKSMQIAATATLTAEYSKVIGGLPFLFWPMPDTVVSTFQGGSAERMVAWMNPLQDPSKIIYAPIDDAEVNLEDRTRQGVSAGVREVIGVFLRRTEGAYAIDRGNVVIDIFTNIPDQIDKAALSRVIERFCIEGAVTPEDFLDQDYLWWKRFGEIDPDFVNLENPPDYQYLTAQALVSSLSQISTEITEPTEEAIRKIFAEVKKRHRPSQHRFFSDLFAAVRKQFPYFSSRDVRNIQRAVGGRITDFDLPEEWLEKPDLFYRRDYDAKKAMLIDLMKQNMRGLSFAEIRLQEVIKYLDNMVKIAQVTYKRRIEEGAEQMRIHREAAKMFEQQGIA